MYGECKKYGFSLINWMNRIFLKKKGFIMLGIPLPLEKSEEEE